MYGQTDQAKRAEDFRDMSKGNLIPRAGIANEVAEAVMFVIKNEFVTGTIVDVDGGSLLS
jgi:NAD(P)-dependent dehydrogenase (short-subunit alcohol dehydrogenase family)